MFVRILARVSCARETALRALWGTDEFLDRTSCFASVPEPRTHDVGCVGTNIVSGNIQGGRSLRGDTRSGHVN